jgi:Glycosyl hydrolases family 15
VASAARDAIAVCGWKAGEPELKPGATVGRFEVGEGASALRALSVTHQEPPMFPPRDQAETRLDAAVRFWRGWVARRTYDVPWRDAVIRSALVLKLLVHAPSGAVAAAATTSLPDEVSGERNWDYRYGWIRDSPSPWTPCCSWAAPLGGGVLLVAAAFLTADSSSASGALPAGRRGPRA